MFQANSEIVSSLPLKKRLPDAVDEPFLEIVQYGKVDALVTGNSEQYPKNICTGTKALTPTQFLYFWRENKTV